MEENKKKPEDKKVIIELELKDCPDMHALMNIGLKAEGMKHLRICNLVTNQITDQVQKLSEEKKIDAEKQKANGLHKA